MKQQIHHGASKRMLKAGGMKLSQKVAQHTIKNNTTQTKKEFVESCPVMSTQMIKDDQGQQSEQDKQWNGQKQCIAECFFMFLRFTSVCSSAEATHLSQRNAPARYRGSLYHFIPIPSVLANVGKLSTCHNLVQVFFFECSINWCRKACLWTEIAICHTSSHFVTRCHRVSVAFADSDDKLWSLLS